MFGIGIPKIKWPKSEVKVEFGIGSFQAACPCPPGLRSRIRIRIRIGYFSIRIRLEPTVLSGVGVGVGVDKNITDFDSGPEVGKSPFIMGSFCPDLTRRLKVIRQLSLSQHTIQTSLFSFAEVHDYALVRGAEMAMDRGQISVFQSL